MRLWQTLMQKKRVELDQKERVKQIQRNFMNKIMMTKVGRVV